MIRLAAAALALLFVSPASAAEKTLNFRLSLGGMTAGIFKSMEMPTHVIVLKGDDVVVVPRTGAADDRPILLTAGSVSTFVFKRVQPMLGQQMSGEIEVIAVNAGVGQRCTFTLDHVFLKAIDSGTVKLRPSELPKFACKGKPVPGE